MANLTKTKTKPLHGSEQHRFTRWARAGMSVCFLDQTTMVFGEREAVKAALDARDGVTGQLPAGWRHGERDGRGGLEGCLEHA